MSLTVSTFQDLKKRLDDDDTNPPLILDVREPEE